jgi:hypothetical protein
VKWGRRTVDSGSVLDESTRDGVFIGSWTSRVSRANVFLSSEDIDVFVVSCHSTSEEVEGRIGMMGVPCHNARTLSLGSLNSVKRKRIGLVRGTPVAPSE